MSGHTDRRRSPAIHIDRQMPAGLRRVYDKQKPARPTVFRKQIGMPDMGADIRLVGQDEHPCGRCAVCVEIREQIFTRRAGWIERTGHIAALGEMVQWAVGRIVCHIIEKYVIPVGQ